MTYNNEHVTEITSKKPKQPRCDDSPVECLVGSKLPRGKELRDLAREFAEDRFGVDDGGLKMIHLAENDFMGMALFLIERGY